MASLTRLGVGGSAAAYKFEPAEVISLDATKGAVTVSGAAGILLSPVAYDAIKGVIDIQAKPATSILQASTATNDIVYVVGKLATLVDGVAEVFNATTAQITIAGKTAEAVAVMMQALPDNVIIRGNNAEFVQYAILDAISGAVVINGMSAFALSNIINATGGSVTISSSQATLEFHPLYAVTGEIIITSGGSWATDPPFIEQRFYAVQEQRDQNMIRITHKRGDTFRRSFIAQGDDGLPVDITNCTIESQVRNKSGTLLSMLAVTKTDAANGEFDLTEEDTSGWPIYRPGSPTYSLYMDIQYTYPSGTVESTETLMISVKEDITL
jgi:hypothetical protein